MSVDMWENSTYKQVAFVRPTRLAACVNSNPSKQTAISIMSTYTILAAAIESTTEEKNSDFLTFLHPVTSRDEAMVHIELYRKKYPDANHVCWAYVIGNTRQPQTQAFSDDGEPSGTAGKPMLHVLTERDVGNSLAVVVRYFGGVKLGAGGLVRAYSAAVSEAVNHAEL